MTFLWWFFVAGVSAGQALLTATAVLIITCPCALALAVPAVQVIATGRLFRGGILLKSPTALERLAEVDTVVFDKTGTLTEPALTLTEPALTLAETADPDALCTAATLAACSRHPLARSLLAASGPTAPAEGVIEHQGQGLSLPTPEGDIRLGSRSFCVIDAPASTGPELWLSRPNRQPVCFRFNEHARTDASETAARLRDMGLRLTLISGDRPGNVASIAAIVGIEDWHAARTPIDKVAHIEALRAQGRNVLMVGDGLNDSPALAAASVSASPSSAADISQTVADLVFQGSKLAPVALALRTARAARRVMRQNLALAIAYNLVMVPLAISGCVTPWLAAAAMSSSSLLVMANSLRLHRTAKS